MFLTLKNIGAIKSVRKRPVGHWDDISNRREYLLAFANQLGFDPFVKENWKGRAQEMHRSEVMHCKRTFFLAMLDILFFFRDALYLGDMAARSMPS